MDCRRKWLRRESNSRALILGPRSALPVTCAEHFRRSAIYALSPDLAGRCVPALLAKPSGPARKSRKLRVLAGR